MSPFRLQPQEIARRLDAAGSAMAQRLLRERSMPPDDLRKILMDWGITAAASWIPLEDTHPAGGGSDGRKTDEMATGKAEALRQ